MIVIVILINHKKKKTDKLTFLLFNININIILRAVKDTND